ncbi:hypothetical protein SAMN05444581_11338 [Methylocapsa palsarum]|uniref:Uncharacterized protein n=2 Tax=Methylocapsa palsarum TaxID=1612308 RepID=A0A1I4B665_9HYPH|nr:hypothetical protein SAMN05444581_11338 [Methylocapsa palsarum]
MADDAPEKEIHPSADLRRTRRLQAAYAMARSLRDSSSFSWEWSLDEDMGHARAVEIEALLGLLKEGDLPGERANSKGGEDAESVRTLLLSSVRAGSDYLRFSVALDMFERVLMAQLISLGASPKGAAEERPSPRQTALATMSTLNSAQAEVFTAFKDKFYGSPAFKIMCAGLFAAALLAAGGLYIAAKVGQYEQMAAEAGDRSAQQAAALREDVSKQLESLYPAMPQDSKRLSEIKSQIDAQEAELNKEIIPRMKQLRDDLGAAQPSLCDRPPLAEGPDAVRGQLLCLKARIADIEENKRSKPIGGESEDDLSPKQWLQIQKALADRQFYHGKIDGKPGGPKRRFGQMTGTRRSIFKWQSAISEMQTGTLTPEQIQRLLASDPLMR